MSTQFWVTSGATMAVAVMMGLGLGSYVTSPQTRPPVSDDSETALFDIGAGRPALQDDQGPAVIRCTGCGPTLADRRMAADMAGLEADPMFDGTDQSIRPEYAEAHDALPASDEDARSAAEQPVRVTRVALGGEGAATPTTPSRAFDPPVIVPPVTVPAMAPVPD